MTEPTFRRVPGPHGGPPTYIHDGTGVLIRKRIVKGEVQYSIHVPENQYTVDGAWTLGEAKRRAARIVREREGAG